MKRDYVGKNLWVEGRYTCDIVNVVLDARNWSAVDLQLVAVPLICNPLSEQPIVCAIKNFPQLTHLDLACSASCDNDLQVDILIRCNYYSVANCNWQPHSHCSNKESSVWTMSWKLCHSAEHIVCTPCQLGSNTEWTHEPGETAEAVLRPGNFGDSRWRTIARW